MAVPSKPVPTIGEPNTTADPKIHDLLAELVSILTGNVDRNNLRDGEIVTAKLADAAVSKVKLATDALNAFLKLAVAADLKVAFGGPAGALAFSAVGDTNSQNIPHGLGVILVFAMVIQAEGGNYSNGVRMHCTIGGKDAVNIVVSGTCTRQPIAPVVACNFYWIAIG